MTSPTVRIYSDESTFIDRAMTAEELKQNVLDLAQTTADNLERQTAAIAKAALLQRLGITADEAALLLS